MWRASMPYGRKVTSTLHGSLLLRPITLTTCTTIVELGVQAAHQMGGGKEKQNRVKRTERGGGNVAVHTDRPHCPGPSSTRAVGHRPGALGPARPAPRCLSY